MKITDQKFIAELEQLTPTNVKEVQGYIAHLLEVQALASNTKELAIREIQQALKREVSF